jgi:hypothetical protein
MWICGTVDRPSQELAELILCDFQAPWNILTRIKERDWNFAVDFVEAFSVQLSTQISYQRQNQLQILDKEELFKQFEIYNINFNP